MKVLITGFEPFGGYLGNPSSDIVLMYKRLHNNVFAIILPCTYFGAFEKIDSVIKIEKPDLVISLGLSSSVQGVRLETRYQNWMNGKYPDNSGFNPQGEKISPGPDAPDFIETNIYIESIKKNFKLTDIPFEISQNADAFICNSLAYLLSYHIKLQETKTKYIFVHIPWTSDYEGSIEHKPGKIFIPTKQVLKAIDLIIEHA